MNSYITLMQKLWGSISNFIVSDCETILYLMTKDHLIKQWLTDELAIHESKELYRDEKYGFVLTAYTEKAGQYRIPHDHGDGWVIYSVVSGTMEMGSYTIPNSTLNRDSLYRLNAGEAKVYLPGEIHDTRCISDQVIILRLTSCDLKVEEKEGRMKRYATS